METIEIERIRRDESKAKPHFEYLIRQSDVPIQGWKGEVFQDISERLGGDTGFPCVFSKNAFKKGLVLFYFVDCTCPTGVANLALALREYVNISRDWDGTLAASFPLIVSFSMEAVGSSDLAGHQKFGWEVLQKLHHADIDLWPDDVARTPETPSWSMCFAGMPIFCNMSSPHHDHRRSRNLGRHFKMVINPRERFDVFAGETPAGRRARENVRGRVEKYDGMEHAPQLASYQAGGLEWQQYALPDQNHPTENGCPFRAERTGSIPNEQNSKREHE